MASTVSTRQEGQPQLLDQVRAAIRVRHYSLRTEETYVHWVRRFIHFQGGRHPGALGEQEVGQFLTALALEQHVSTATQNQALNTLVFLYRQVLRREVGWIDHLMRAKRPHRLPLVLCRH